MPGKTDAQKRAQEKYMEDISRVEITMSKDKRQRLLAHVKRQGEKSVNAFVNRAIDETMERDKKETE